MGSTQKDVEVSYGVGNDFFKLWLDKQMNYTCAVFEDEVNFSDDFEEAQNNKLKFLSKLAHIDSHTESVLDIGCGWGANVEYQVKVNKIPDMHGFTLSSSQYEYCVQRNIPNATLQCQDYKLYEAPKKFDAVINICMVEHIVTPEDARAGKAIDLYRDFFKRVHSWTKPETYLAMQAITRNAVPRKKEDLDNLRHSTYTIFPNAVTPRVEDLIVASFPYYEVKEVYSRRLHYRKTCEHWLTRLQKNEKVVLEKWGQGVYDDYVRYLSCCIKAFENHWQSLHQFSFKRID